MKHCKGHYQQAQMALKHRCTRHVTRHDSFMYKRDFFSPDSFSNVIVTKDSVIFSCDFFPPMRFVYLYCWGKTVVESGDAAFGSGDLPEI